jgi:hypothetical protein
MRLHDNPDCPHDDDSLVFELRRLHDVDDHRGVLREVTRLREIGVMGFQRRTVELHEAGALFALGSIAPEEFLRRVDAIADECFALDTHADVAEIVHWCVGKLLIARREDLAYDVVATRYERLECTNENVSYEHLSRALLAMSELDFMAALAWCQLALECLKSSHPCAREHAHRELAGLFLKFGPGLARQVLTQANIPTERLEAVLKGL